MFSEAPLTCVGFQTDRVEGYLAAGEYSDILNMQRVLQWLQSPFRQAPIPTARSNAINPLQWRPSPLPNVSVASGRILKSRVRSKSPSGWKRRRVPNTQRPSSHHSSSPSSSPVAPSPKRCQRFVVKLKQAASRRNNIDIYRRRRADIDQHWKRLQQQIEAGSIRCERLRKRKTDGSRRTAHSLQQVLERYRGEQEGLDREKAHVDTLLRLWPQILANLERDLFADFQWVDKHCQAVPGCFRFSPELLERFQDARDVRERVQRYRNELRDGNGSSPDIERAMSAREEWYEDVMSHLYGFIRAVLLKQGLSQPENGDGTLNKPYTWPTDDTPKPRPVLTQTLLAEYEQARDWLEKCLKAHDQHDENEENDWKKYSSKPDKFPNPTQEEFQDLRRDELRRHAANLRKAEDLYVRTRDAAFTAGADALPLRLTLGRAMRRLDFPEFAGVHVDDGEVSSCGPEKIADRDATMQAAQPDIYRWMNGHADLPDDPRTAASPRLAVDREGYDRLVEYCNRRGDSLELQLRAQQPAVDVQEHNQLLAKASRPDDEREGDIMPWESASQAERTHYVKSCIETLRRHERKSAL